MVTGRSGLDQLEDQIRRDFRYLNYPPDNWVKPMSGPDGASVADVVIIGGGMCGMAAAFGLRREGIQNFRIFDARDAGAEGPWVTTARMRTLRSPKRLAGPNLGLPNLTFRMWCVAKYGREMWESFEYIPREMWMEYLVWYRHILDIPTENNHQLERIEPEGDLLRLHLQGPDGPVSLLARHAVLATGRAAFGGCRIPAVFEDIPPSLIAHTEEAIDFSAMAGKRVLVIGGAASAVDSAAVALEQGAGEVHLLMRATEIPRINKFKNTAYPGFFRGTLALDDERRWRFLHYSLASRIAPPRLSMLRLKEYDNFHIHKGVSVRQAAVKDGAVQLDGGDRKFTGDFVILGTGYAIDMTRQPELAAHAGDIRLWCDHFTPPAGLESDELGRFPYLGPGFEFLEKEPGAAPHLARIHLFNAASMLSHSGISADIPGVNVGVERLVNALASAFFREDADRHLADLYAYAEPELLGDEWRED